MEASANKPQGLRIAEGENFRSMAGQDKVQAQNNANQSKHGRQTTNQEAVNRIEKLFHAVDEKLKDSSYSGIVEDSLRCQIFGVFGQAYKKWQMQNQGAKADFVSYFHESKILSGKSNFAIFKALLFFNLPEDLIFHRKVKPEICYEFPDPSKNQDGKHELKDLIEEQEEEKFDENKANGNQKRTSYQNIILMEVEAGDPRDRQTFIIGGYASH